MTFICPICIQKLNQRQKSVRCTSCLRLIHHNNRANCSGLTDFEFELLSHDSNKRWECDKCITNSFTFLPFTHFDESNCFKSEINNPSHSNSINVNHLIPNVDQDYIALCDSIENRINLDDATENEINLPTPIN